MFLNEFFSTWSGAQQYLVGSQSWSRWRTWFGLLSYSTCWKSASSASINSSMILGVFWSHLWTKASSRSRSALVWAQDIWVKDVWVTCGLGNKPFAWRCTMFGRHFVGRLGDILWDVWEAYQHFVGRLGDISSTFCGMFGRHINILWDVWETYHQHFVGRLGDISSTRHILASCNMFTCCVCIVTC